MSFIQNKNNLFKIKIFKFYFYHYDKVMLNDLINKNIEDLHHLDNHQQLQVLNLDHQFEIHRY
jgi:hypothetical protein